MMMGEGLRLNPKLPSKKILSGEPLSPTLESSFEASIDSPLRDYPSKLLRNLQTNLTTDFSDQVLQLGALSTGKEET